MRNGSKFKTLYFEFNMTFVNKEHLSAQKCSRSCQLSRKTVARNNKLCFRTTIHVERKKV